jgi:hypothetical protein
MSILDDPIDADYLASKGYALVNGEYVRTSSLLTSAVIADTAEKNIVPFFRGIGFEVKRVPRGLTKTVDYECGNLGLEVTALQDYLPKSQQLDKILERHRETNSRICAYMYLKAGKPKIEILDEQNLNNNTSILCLRQHISCYRPKLMGKINEKYYQDESHDLQIINIDFRLAHFDSLSLKWEIKSILNILGRELNSLAGILMSIPKELDSEMSSQPDYIFVRNPYCEKQHELVNKLDNYSMATTSDW